MMVGGGEWGGFHRGEKALARQWAAMGVWRREAGGKTAALMAGTWCPRTDLFPLCPDLIVMTCSKNRGRQHPKLSSS